MEELALSKILFPARKKKCMIEYNYGNTEE